jgi:hypothetical protein
MSDITNILYNDDELNEDQLMKYLQGKASDEELHAIEQQMSDDHFTHDAMQGLETFKDKQQLQQYVNDLNYQLQKYTKVKKQRKLRRKLQDNNWLLFTIAFILLLCLLAYYGFRLQQRIKNNKPTTTTRQVQNT